jgi:protein TonB
LGLHLLLVLAMIWWASRPIEIEEPPEQEEPFIEIAYIEISPPPSPRPPAEPDVLAQPIPGQNAAPDYPAQARRLNQQGRVLLRARVNAQGQVVQVQVVESSGFPALDQSAERAVQAWRSSPALSGTTPIDSSVIVPIQFSLN